MKSLKVRGAAALIGLIALGGAAQAANVEELVRETQRVVIDNNNNSNQISMVWWLPLEFWSETVRSNKELTPEARSEIISVMSEYTVVAVLRAKAGATGIEEPQPRDELAKHTRLEFNDKVLQPLAPESLSPTAALVLTQLKPVLAQAAGPVGEGMEFLVYPAKVDGKPIDAGLPGKLLVTFYDKPQMWRLPLGSVMSPKLDKNTGEVFPGNFEFNPFTGKKIETGK